MTSPATDPVETGGAAKDGPAADGLAFVTFTAGGLGFALPLAAVLEVIRPPELVRIPLGPPSLDGLAQWHGVAMPVLDLRRALGRDGTVEDTRRGAGARVVVVGHHGQPVGFLVDGMTGMVRTSPDRIDSLADAEAPAVDAALLSGVLRDRAVTVLDGGALIDRQFGGGWGVATARPVSGGPAAPDTRAAPAAVADQARLVVFRVADQEFALPVERVREILPAPDGVTRMAKAKAHLLGVMTLRDRLLPLVGLRALFGLGGQAGRRVVVVQAGAEAGLVGVVVDEVQDILRVDRERIDPVPPLLAREPDFEDLDGIVRADGGRRLVSVLSAERLFRHGLSLGGEGEAAAMNGSASGPDDGAAGVERFVVFRLAGAEYGLPVAAVQEVLRRPDSVSPLPNAPDFVTGVLTLRGTVLPLIDQRRLLRLPSGVGVGGAAGDGSGERGRVVVVARGEARAGLLVDGLSGLLAVPGDRIGPAPAVSDAQRRLIRRVATLTTAQGNLRLVLLMEPDGLLDMDSLSALLASA